MEQRTLGRRDRVKGYERDFVSRIKDLEVTGPDFARLAKETLEQVLGESGSLVVLHGANRKVLESPEKFAQELSNVFGLGAIPILKTIVVSVLVYSRSPDHAETEGGFPDIPATVESKYGVKAAREAYLHDHRTKDEMDEYFEQLDKQHRSS